MKTLEQIIERQDYKKLSKKLANTVEELAEKLMGKMQELDLEDFGDLHIYTMKANGYAQKYICTGLGTEDFSGALNLPKNSADGRGRDGFYYCGDFNCWVEFAGNKHCLDFLNRYKSFLSGLDEYETKKSAEIERAMSEINK